MSKSTPITADHVEALLESPSVDAALVRYNDGHLEVRSTVRTGDKFLDAYEVIVYQQDLPAIDGSGLDFANLTYGDRDAMAQQLALEEEQWTGEVLA